MNNKQFQGYGDLLNIVPDQLSVEKCWQSTLNGETYLWRGSESVCKFKVLETTLRVMKKAGTG
jgi:hypothetical protein